MTQCRHAPVVLHENAAMSKLPAAAPHALLDVNAGAFLLALAAFASALALRLCDPMLPALARDFGTSVPQAAMVVTATSLAYGASLLAVAWLGDHLGKFRVITGSCLASAVAALCCALSPSLGWLALARVLNGAATAALIPLSMAWIGDHVPVERRQLTLARFMSGQISGLILGQLAGGLLADTVGWRWAFGLMAVIYGLIGLRLRRSPHHRKPAAVSEAQALSAWLHVRGRVAEIVRQPRARFILITVALESLGSYGLMTYIPAYLHERFGLSLFHAGAVMAVFGLGGLLYTLAARHWIRTLGAVNLPRVGGALLGLAFLTLALAPSWGWGLLATLVAGVGFYLLHNTLQLQATQMAAPASRGLGMALFATCFFMGTAGGVTLGAPIIHHLGAPAAFILAALLQPILGWRVGSKLKVWQRGH
jgi:predicted MFS family arabinose efflux permease